MQWQWLAEAFRKMVDICPVEDYETESCLMAEMYRRKISTFTFYNPVGKMKMMCICFSMAEAFAINKFFSAVNNDTYNIYIRPQIEGKLMPAKNDD